MNLKCKAILKISMIKIQIIYVAIKFNGNHILKIERIKKFKTFIVDF
jgi:hypothetical protein